MAEVGGTFQQAVLISIATLKGADGVRIAVEVRRRLGRSITSGALHNTLQRLERKHFISSEPSSERRRSDGSGPRNYKIEVAGIAALHRTKAEIDRAWQDFPPRRKSR